MATKNTSPKAKTKTKTKVQPPSPAPAPKPKKAKEPGPLAAVRDRECARIAQGAVLGAALAGPDQQEAVALRAARLAKAAKAMGLTERHRVFCEKVVLDTLPGVQAYLESGFTCKRAAANASAARLLATANVSAYCDLLRADAATSAAMDRDQYVAYLIDVMRTPAGKITANSPLCQKYKVTEDAMEIVMPDKMRAAERLAKTMKWDVDVVETHEVADLGDIAELVRTSPAVREELARLLATADEDEDE